jgi:hypothetical protein
MDEQDVGWRNGWCWWGFWLGSWVAVDDVCLQPKPYYYSNSAWSTQTRWCFQNHQSSLSGHIRTWWNEGAGCWTEKWVVLMGILAWKLGNRGWFLSTDTLII